MTITEFIDTVPAERRALFTQLHETITANDAGVTPVVKPMMGKDMILYEEQGKVMKYGLASVKNYMSVHCLPMYMNVPLHTKYEALAPAAKFQKGCINFTDETELPVSVVAGLIKDCSAISILALLEARKKKK